MSDDGVILEATSVKSLLSLRYTRRWNRWLARVLPSERRKLRMRQRLLDASSNEILAAHNRAMTDVLLYGSASMRVSHTTTAPQSAPPAPDSDGGGV